MRRRSALWYLAVLSLWSTANATTINYDLTNIAGNTWQYDFTVSNDSLPAAIDEFTVFFDRNLFDNLQLGAQPADWDPLVIQRDLAIPADGYFDVLALAGGIDPGLNLGGFQVMVDFLSTGTPGSPYFSVVDPDSFATLDQGSTRSNQAPVPVPEPGTLTLIGAAMLATGFRKRFWRSKAST